MCVDAALRHIKGVLHRLQLGVAFTKGYINRIQNSTPRGVQRVIRHAGSGARLIYDLMIINNRDCGAALQEQIIAYFGIEKVLCA